MNISLFLALNHLVIIPLVAQLASFFAVSFPYFIFTIAVIFLISRFRQSMSTTDPFRALTITLRESFFVSISTAFGWLSASVLKSIFMIPRPFTTLLNVHILFPETGYSFPSGHATTFAALALAIFLIDRRWGTFFMIAAFLIGLARIIAGVHYPLDILGGFFLGMLVVFAVKQLFKIPKT